MMTQKNQLIRTFLSVLTNSKPKGDQVRVKVIFGFGNRDITDERDSDVRTMQYTGQVPCTCQWGFKSVFCQ